MGAASVVGKNSIFLSVTPNIAAAMAVNAPNSKHTIRKALVCLSCLKSLKKITFILCTSFSYMDNTILSAVRRNRVIKIIRAKVKISPILAAAKIQEEASSHPLVTTLMAKLRPRGKNIWPNRLPLAGLPASPMIWLSRL